MLLNEFMEELEDDLNIFSFFNLDEIWDEIFFVSCCDGCIIVMFCGDGIVLEFDGVVVVFFGI